MRAAAVQGVEAGPLGAQRLLVTAGVVALVGGALALGASSGWRLGALFVIGALLGMTLYQGAFGFTSAYRRAIRERDVSEPLAQLVMLGLAMLLFAPILASGIARGAVAPASLQVALGSFIFGLGMQLGGGCGSGTLYTVGGGNARMVVTLVAFCVGAFVGSLDMSRYAGLPSLGAVSFAEAFGWPVAILVQLGILAILWIALKRYAGEAPQRPLWPGLTWKRL
ncbi:MAG: YeeE/YedE thiosulfate transporter family protein, partial [Geminicoccaceae bacterium]|nr:YeeE/YedE thiosulfate transporter family protein [Geminicoccaceae bacterium]